MKKGKIILSVLASVGIWSLQAQTPTASDMLMLSQQNYSFATARSASMGGAFTSLGADLASMSINPAGLGMYRSSEFGFSPIISSSNMKTQFGGNSYSSSKTQFAVGNLAAALNLYQGSGTLTSFTLGIGYNRLADFNASSYAYQSGINNSYAEIFAEQLYGVNVNDFGYDANNPNGPYQIFNKLSLFQWGGALAYQAGILDPLGTDAYSPWGPDTDNPDRTGPLSVNATMNPSQWLRTKGSIGEYVFSGGFNFNNKLYVGFSIGLQDIYYRGETDYLETYNNNDRRLNGMDYIQTQRFDGTGVNFKFGMIARPTENLRIGVAVHTPTFIHMEEQYQAFMSADYKGDGWGKLIDSNLASNTYDMNGPTHLLGGISYSLPGIGLLSFDYERTWYNGMRLKNTGYAMVENDLKYDATTFLQASNSYRAGLELTPTNKFFVRAGYAYYGNCLKQQDYQFYANNNVRSDLIYVLPKHADIDSYYNISAGLGYRFGSFYADIAYVYTNYNYAPSPIFYFMDKPADFVIDSGDVNYEQTRHTVILSLGVKF